ncbi:hypothetical protein ACFYWD_20615 [Streptomyces sp. NPDC003781]|uniref:hypothetical protein n=1 Tax=Streptomyces sp. NPDC003781 TaxID=3364686 RepID=UPI00369FF525
MQNITERIDERPKVVVQRRLNLPRRMRIPGAWEIFSADGRHGGTVCSQTPYRDIRARIDYLIEREPDAGWTYEYIPTRSTVQR